MLTLLQHDPKQASRNERERKMFAIYDSARYEFNEPDHSPEPRAAVLVLRVYAPDSWLIFVQAKCFLAGYCSWDLLEMDFPSQLKELLRCADFLPARLSHEVYPLVNVFQ